MAIAYAECGYMLARTACYLTSTEPNANLIHKRRTYLAQLLTAALFLVQLFPTTALATSPVGATPGKFSVSPSGSASYQVPIVVAPGVKGMSPKLSLSYNSQGGNGILGVGWSLSGLSVITRCPAKKGIDGYFGKVGYDENDRFCLDGQRLIEVSNNEYRTQSESWQKIIAVGQSGSGPLSFEVYTKDGRILEFGATPDSRINAAKVQYSRMIEEAVLMAIDGSNKFSTASYLSEAPEEQSVRVWSLNKIIDQSGNYLTITYENTTSASYPVRIDYTGNINTAPSNYIEFSYEENREDNSIRYEGGTAVSNTKRLSQISSITDGTLIRHYNLTYQYSPETNRSRLTSIQECGTDNICKLPTKISWRGGSSWTNWNAVESATAENTSRLYSKPEWYSGDFNGDGLTDLVKRSENWGKLYLSEGNGKWNGPIKDSFLGVYEADSNGNSVLWLTGDVNGDGMTDLIRRGSSLKNMILIADGEGGWIEKSNTDSNAWIKYHSKILTGDVNGDGRVDLINIHRDGGAQNFVLLADGNGGWTRITGVAGEPGNISSDVAWFTGDANGDGLTDLIRRNRSGGAGNYVLFADGSGGWEVHQSEDGRGHADAILLTGDVNGDGLTDLIRRHKNGGTNNVVLMATGTGEWVEKISSDGYGGVGRHQEWVAVDVNGDNLTDVITFNMETPNTGIVFLADGEGDWKVVTNSGGVPYIKPYGKYFPGDFNGDGLQEITFIGDAIGLKPPITTLQPNIGFPDLVSSVKNGLGNEVTIDYKTLVDSSVYVKDSTAFTNLPTFTEATPLDPALFEYPYMNVQTPMHVVSSSSASNGINGLTNRIYRYQGLRWNHEAKQNLGFRFMAVNDVEAKSETITEFIQHYDGRQGRSARSRTSVAGKIVNMAYIKWSVVPADPANPTRQYFTHQNTQMKQSFDLNGTRLPFTVTSYDYTSYGRPEKVTIKYSDGYSQTTINQYESDNIANWNIGKVSRTLVTATTPDGQSVTRTSAFEYSGGLLNREIIEPDAAALRLTTTYQHDQFGNRTKATVTGVDFSPRETTTVYDPSGRFVKEIYNAKLHKETREHDPRNGQVTSLTGPNGLTTAWAYDGFGRKVQEIRADGTSTFNSYIACDGTNCPQYGAYYMRTDTSGAPSVVEYFDKLNRTIRTIKKGFGGSWKFQDQVYNELGQVALKSRPSFKEDIPQWSTLIYDDLGRIAKVTEPGNRSSYTAYNGLETTTTNPLSQVVIKLKNSQGKLKQVTDDAGLQSYDYDPFGNLTKVTDPAGNQIAMAYDVRGRKISMNDPDMGSWSYTYYTTGELKTQTDAKNQTTSNIYDELGRLVTRIIPEGTSTWVYDEFDTTNKGIGKLSRVTGYDGTSQVLEYNELGQLKLITKNINAISMTASYVYDEFSRLKTTHYPGGGFSATNVYNAFGYLKQVTGGAENLLYWQANAQNANGQVTSESFGNLIGTERTYDPVTGYLKHIATQGFRGVVQDLDYQFDEIGNLTMRADNLQGVSENFAYDSLNRLISVTGPVNKSYQYDSIGNITYKTDVGSYLYGEGNAGPHAVTRVSGMVNATYTYDANGNMASGGGRIISYTSFNKPGAVNASSFFYDADYNRVRKETIDTQTLYFDKLYEQHKIGVLTTHKFFLYAGGQLVSIHEENSLNEKKDLFVHTDHLGSISSYTDDTGNVDLHQSFNAFGKRRNVDGSEGVISQTASTSRGFTGHEMDDDVGLINMNARLYDPLLGRFVSPDSVIPAPESTQGLNRYSYVYNNPLSYTDPSGHNPLFILVNAILQKQMVAVFGQYIGNAFINNMLAGAFMTGINTNFDPEEMAKGGMQAGAWFGVGEVTGGWSEPGKVSVGQVLAHGVMGGLFAEMNGKNNFLQGFVGNALPKLLSSRIDDLLVGSKDSAAQAGRVVVAAMLGGVASSLAGGEFEDGAWSAAFARMFNDGMHPDSKKKTNKDWEALGTLQVPDGGPASVTFNGGNEIRLDIETRTSSLSIDGIRLTVSSNAIDSSGNPIPNVPRNYVDRIDTHLVGGNKRTFYFRNKYAGVKGYQWTVTVPPQQSVNGNSSGHYINYYTR